MRIFCLFLIILADFSELAAQTGSSHPMLKVGNNFRIHPGSVTQTETFIAKSPVDQNTFFVTCNILTFIPFFISEGIYVTSDAGESWSGNDTCTGYPIGYHGGDPGLTIDKNGTFILTRLGRSPFVGLYSHFSTDQGQSWSTQKSISTDDLERASLTTDAIPASSHFGRSYAVWVPFASPFPLMFSYTDDGAQHWSTQSQINHPTIRSAGGDCTIGPNGTIYTCWAGVTDFSPFKEILVGFASSTDGGGNWEIIENAFAINGISGVLANKNNIRVNSLPSIATDTTNGPRRGWIYIVSGQKDLAPAGTDPDIVLNRSHDGGLTWSAGIRVNQDALNNGKTQYFPAIHVDKYGGIDILFYDDRNTTNDSAGVFLARSLDGGDTWAEFEISDHHFKPAPIGGLGQGYQGDNIDISSTDSKLIPVWMDNSSGLYQLWSTPVRFTDINGIGDPVHKQGNLVLEQNHPNPFQFNTRIGYQLSETGLVSVKVFDVFGNEVADLVNEIKGAGNYEVNFDLSEQKIDHSLKSHIYFYCLKVNGFSQTRKMILLDKE
jgi:hypothetical protein